MSASFPAGAARRVAFVTSADISALTDDDRLGRLALERMGMEVVPAAWDDPAVRWTEFDLVVVRSCWDYFERTDEFRRWLDMVEESGAPVVNPPAFLRWNMDKRYLRELEAAGARIPETAWVDGPDAPDLARLLAERGWEEAVVKPVVSGGGFETWRVRVDDGEAASHQARLTRLAQQVPMMVQRFLPAILADGELSLVYLEGQFSHALVKRARPGEFRVQAMHGGTVEPVEAPAWLRAEGERVIAAAAARGGLESPPLYARVDGVVAEDGGFLLMELECLEPDLFLRTADGAAERFAVAVAGKRARSWA